MVDIMNECLISQELISKVLNFITEADIIAESADDFANMILLYFDKERHLFESTGFIMIDAIAELEALYAEGMPDQNDIKTIIHKAIIKAITLGFVCERTVRDAIMDVETNNEVLKNVKRDYEQFSDKVKRKS